MDRKEEERACRVQCFTALVGGGCPIGIRKERRGKAQHSQRKVLGADDCLRNVVSGSLEYAPGAQDDTLIIMKIAMKNKVRRVVMETTSNAHGMDAELFQDISVLTFIRY